jgi:hypothetical protein
MADSKRLAALKALTTFLETEVTPANGYDFDLTGRVFRGREMFDMNDPVPMVSMRDNINPDRFPNTAGNNDGEPGVARNNWIILMQGWAAVGEANFSLDNAENLMATVKKALAKLDFDPPPGSPIERHANYLLNGLIVSVKMEPGTVRPAEQNSTVADFWMRVILGFTENVRDPFDHA